MTPTGLRARLLQVQMAELRLIVTDLKSSRPANAAELVAVVRELQDELKAAAVALQAKTVREDRVCGVPSDAAAGLIV